MHTSRCNAKKESRGAAGARSVGYLGFLRRSGLTILSSHITDGSDGISRQGGDRGRTVSVADDEPSPTDSRGLRRRGERKGSRGEKDTGEGETQAEQPEAAQRKTHEASPEEEVLTEDRKRNGAQEADQDIGKLDSFPRHACHSLIRWDHTIRQ